MTTLALQFLPLPSSLSTIHPLSSLSSSIPPGLASPGVVSPSVPLHSLRSTRRGGGRKEDDTKEERRVQEWNGRD